MRSEFFYQIVLITEDGVKPLQGFRCQSKPIAYEAADKRLEYWSNKYPNGIVDIVEVV